MKAFGLNNFFSYNLEHDIKIDFSEEYFQDFCKDHSNIIDDKEWTDLNMNDFFLKSCNAKLLLENIFFIKF